MKKLTLVLSAALALALSVAASPVFASNAKFPGKGEICHERSHDDACANSHRAHKPAEAHKVPEIDAANAALAIALMGGIVALRRERAKK